MNKRVMKNLIALLWVFLGLFTILKVFFPNHLLVVAENEKIILVGTFIGGNPVLSYLFNVLMSMVVSQFYFCACLQCWRLHRSQYLILILLNSALNLGYFWNSIIPTILDTACLLFVPILFKAKLKQTASVFFLHQVGQLVILFIRSEPLYLAHTNYLTSLILMLDVYVWLCLYYLYSNLYKEEKSLWELLLYPFSVILAKMKSKRKSRK